MAVEPAASGRPVVELADGVSIRPITAADDPAVAAIIRTVMTEYACSGEGFAIQDPEVDHMTQAYPGGPAQYYVVSAGGRVLGAGGFGPLAGVPASEQTCELRKMYFLPALRGRGAGRALLELLLQRMRDAGYRRCYLETTEQMHAARQLYTRLGFTAICAPLGATGHHGCDRFYLRPL